jgi:hypothetical protein
MQGNDFVQSVMYRHGITCASCHDVHGTDNPAQLRKPADIIRAAVRVVGAWPVTCPRSRPRVYPAHSSALTPSVSSRRQ